jgi:hypothetical protein
MACIRLGLRQVPLAACCEDMKAALTQGNAVVYHSNRIAWVTSIALEPMSRCNFCGAHFVIEYEQPQQAAE